VKYDVSQNPDYLEFASYNIGTDFTEDTDANTIAVFTDDYEFCAVVVYNGREDANIGMSIASASPKWGSRDMLRTCFDYPFNQLGLNRVTGYIRESNTKARQNAERIGFKLEGELRQYYEDGESCMVYGMTKDECRWIHGKEE
jgi:RimJ/RimL family protein N-acetyltransferase